jgi:hypothetical protein
MCAKSSHAPWPTDMHPHPFALNLPHPFTLSLSKGCLSHPHPFALSLPHPFALSLSKGRLSQAPSA